MKKSKFVTQILTKQVQETLLNAASLKEDDNNMMTGILGEYLIAIEGYHKHCHKQITVIVSRPTKLMKQNVMLIMMYSQNYLKG